MILRVCEHNNYQSCVLKFLQWSDINEEQGLFDFCLFEGFLDKV